MDTEDTARGSVPRGKQEAKRVVFQFAADPVPALPGEQVKDWAPNGS